MTDPPRYAVEMVRATSLITDRKAKINMGTGFDAKHRLALLICQ